MKNSIDQIAKKTWSYWYIDGLVEIGAGAIIASIGVAYLLTSLLPDSPTKGFLTALIMPVIIIIGGWLDRRAIQYLKERLTFPRTGYISYHKSPKNRRWLRIPLMIIVALSIGIVTTLLLRQVRQNLIPVIIAGLLAIYTAYLGYRTAVGRFYLVSIWTFFVGGMVSWLNLISPYDSGVFFSGIGLGWIASGAAALIHYLLTTSPAPIEEEDIPTQQNTGKGV